jgi:hypothetical protein
MSSTATSTIDICASALQQIDTFVQEAKQNLATQGGSDLLEDEEKRLKQKYGASYCSASEEFSRRQPEARQLTEASAYDARRDTTHPACEPNPFSTHEFPSFFSVHRVNADALDGVGQCFDSFTGQGPFKEMSSMVDTCQKFCNPNDQVITTIPILIGSPTFGLDFGMNTRILGQITNPQSSDGLKSFNSTKYSTCLKQRDAFLEIQHSLTAFVSSMLEFDAARLKYQSSILEAVEQATTTLQSQDTAEQIQQATGDHDKEDVMVNLYQYIIMSKIYAGSDDLKLKLRQTQEATSTLRQRLSGEMDDFNQFVTDCTSNFWPTPQLYDMCFLDGTPCLDYKASKHVTCGCVVNLASQVGINQTDNELTDICAEARQNASSYIGKVVESLDKSHHSDLISTQEADMKERYHSDYCSPFLTATESSGSGGGGLSWWEITLIVGGGMAALICVCLGCCRLNGGTKGVPLLGDCS